MIGSCSGEDVADRRSDGHGNGDVNHGGSGHDGSL